jgi:ribosomal protein S18 acetylase RimI-like enzyme
VVRSVRQAEWEAYRAVRLRALRTDPLAFGSTLEREEAFPPELWKGRITRGTESLSSATWVAVDPRGRFVGMTGVADLEGTFHLFAMWVDPGRRGEGIGGQLLDAALTWISESHRGRTVQLDVNPGQVAAVHLYESRGFRRTGKSSPLAHTAGEQVIEMTWTARPPP